MRRFLRAIAPIANLPGHTKGVLQPRGHALDGSHIPRSDAQWSGGLPAQLSPNQIRDTSRAAGYEPGQVNAYGAVVEKRIAELNQL